MNRPIDTHGIQRTEHLAEQESRINDVFGTPMVDDKPFEGMTEKYSHEKNIGKIKEIQKKTHEIIVLSRSLEQENDIQQGRKSAFIEDITNIQGDSLHRLRKAFE